MKECPFFFRLSSVEWTKASFLGEPRLRSEFCHVWERRQNGIDREIPDIENPLKIHTNAHCFFISDGKVGTGRGCKDEFAGGLNLRKSVLTQSPLARSNPKDFDLTAF
jgi:hypothetical protein